MSKLDVTVGGLSNWGRFGKVGLGKTMLVLLLGILWSVASHAQAPGSYLPSVKVVQGDLVTPASAMSHYNAINSGASLTLPTGADDYHPHTDSRLKELAGTLGYDQTQWATLSGAALVAQHNAYIDAAFEYVRNGVEFNPQFGLQHGAMGAAFNGSGTAMDQIHLLGELMDVASIPVKYRLGIYSPSASEFKAWFGTDVPSIACRILADGGIPAKVNGATSCSTLTGYASDSNISVEMLHMWAVITIDGTDYAFNPSVKTHDIYDGVLDIKALSGLTSTGLDTAIAGTKSTNAYSGFNPKTLLEYLEGRSSALLTALKLETNAGRSVDEVIGGQRLKVQHGAPRDASPTGYGSVYGTWANIPTELTAKVTLTLTQTADTSLNQSVTLPLSKIGSDFAFLSPVFLTPGGRDTGPRDPIHEGDSKFELSILRPGSTDHTVEQQSGSAPVTPVTTNVLASGDNLLMLQTSLLDTLNGTWEIEIDYDSAAAADTGDYLDGYVKKDGDTRTANILVINAGSKKKGNLFYDRSIPAKTNLWYGKYINNQTSGNPGNPINWSLGTYEITAISHDKRLKLKAGLLDTWHKNVSSMSDLFGRVGDNRSSHYLTLGLISSKIETKTDLTFEGDELNINVDTMLGAVQLSAQSKSREAYAVSAAAGLSALEGLTLQSQTGNPRVNTAVNMLDWYGWNASYDAMTGVHSGPYSRNYVAGTSVPNGIPAVTVYNSGMTSAQIEVITPGFGAIGSTYTQNGYTLIRPDRSDLGPVEDMQQLGPDTANYYLTGDTYVGRLGRTKMQMAYKSAGGIIEVSHLVDVDNKGAAGIKMPDFKVAAKDASELQKLEYDKLFGEFSVNPQNGSLSFSPPADISVGSDADVLSFTRTYESVNGGNGPLGQGWSHNFDTNVVVSTNLDVSLNGPNPQASIPALITALAIQELVDDNTDVGETVPQSLLVGAWFAREVFDAEVILTTGSGSDKFYKVPGAGFTNVDNPTATLTQTGVRKFYEGMRSYYDPLVLDDTFDQPDPGHTSNSMYERRNWVSYEQYYDYSGVDFEYTSVDGTEFTFDRKPADATRQGLVAPCSVWGRRVYENTGHNASYCGKGAGSWSVDEIETVTGRTQQYTYVGGVLAEVKNVDFNRSLKFEYEPHPGASFELTSYIEFDPITGELTYFAPSSWVSQGQSSRLKRVYSEDGSGQEVSFSYDGSVKRTIPVLTSYTSVDDQTHDYASSAFAVGDNTPLEQKLYLDSFTPAAFSLPFFSVDYDNSGRVTEITNAEGHKSQHGANGIRNRSVDPLGNQAVSLFSAQGLLGDTIEPEYADGKSKRTHTEYDGLGRQIKVQVFDDVEANASLISESTKAYNKYHQVTQEIQARVPYDFKDTNGNPVGIYDAANGAPYNYEQIIQNYAYEDTTWPTKVTKTYDPRYPTEERFASLNYYDETTGLLELSLNAKEYCLSLASLLNQPKAGTYSVEQSGQSLTKEILSYKRCGATAYFYDNLGRVTETHESSNLDVPRWSNPTPYQDRIWLETTFEYWPDTGTKHGALKRTIQGGASEALRMYMDFDWDAIGNLLTVTNNGTTGTLGYTTTATYDDLRRITKTVDPEAGESRYTFDDAGRLRGISKLIGTNQWAVTKADFFPTGRLKHIEDPDGDITAKFSYDAAGRVVTTTDAENRVTKTLYYPNGKTKCTIRAFGNTALQQAYQTMEYAADGQVKSVRPAKGSDKDTCARKSGTGDKYDTTSTYDGYRRLYQTVYPKRAEDATAAYASTSDFARGVGHTYTRQLLDQKGQTTTYRTRRDDVITSTYALDGQLSSRTTPETHYTYLNYADKRLDSSNIYPVINGTVSTAHRRYAAYSYTSLNQPASESIREYENGVIGALTSTVASYDTAGQMLKLAYENGSAAPYTAYSYTKTGQMKTARFTPDGNYNNLNYVAFYNYDIAGRKTHAYLGDYTKTDTSGAPAYALQAYTYDADSDLKTLAVKWSDPGQSTSAHVGFIYKYDQDASGKIDAAFATSANWRYTPPSVPKKENYAGPATNASGDPVNALDQYADVDMDDGAGALTQTYDGAGNLTSVGDGRTYTYNSENQLIRAVKTGVFDFEYWYDAQGRRSHSIDHDNLTETFHKHWGQMEIGDYDVTRAGGVTPTLIGTGGNPPPIPAKVTGYSAQFHIILGQGVDNRIAFHDASGDELSFYLTNHQGSTVAMTDEDGKILSHANGGRYVYDAYGAEVSVAPPTGQPFRYTGRRLDANTGLYYYRARYYDTGTGRFLQTDPIGYQDQMNLYNYVHNDPVNNVDPTGKQCATCLPPPTGLTEEQYEQWIEGQLAMAEAEGLATIAIGLEALALSAGLTDGPQPGPVDASAQGVIKKIITKLARKKSCFTAGTLVNTQEGLRAIEDIDVGDLVWSQNPETGEVALKAVTNIIPRHDRYIWTVTLTTKSGTNEVFETTSEHPWWVRGVGWVETQNLLNGQTLLSQLGETPYISNVARTTKIDGTYNITVADFETYYVGRQQILVHNNCDDKLPKVKAKDRRAQQRQDAKKARAKEAGGEPDGGGYPKSNIAQNKQFKSVVDKLNLNKEQANQLHREISKQNLNRDQIMERAQEMFGVVK